MIAIKEIEMPSCCGECNLTTCKGKDEPWNYCCSITLTDINLDDTEKPSDCPLVEIDEHNQKLDKIEQIIDSWDCATVLAENDWKYIKKIKKVLEQE